MLIWWIDLSSKPQWRTPCDPRADFVLAWEEPHNPNVEDGKAMNAGHSKWRETFLSKLRFSGLLMEKVNPKAHLKRLHHLPMAFDLLCCRLLVWCPEGRGPDQDQDPLRPPERPLECPVLLCRGNQLARPPA